MLFASTSVSPETKKKKKRERRREEDDKREGEEETDLWRVCASSSRFLKTERKRDAQTRRRGRQGERKKELCISVEFSGFEVQVLGSLVVTCRRDPRDRDVPLDE